MNPEGGEDKVSKLNNWFSVAKNFIWVFGLVLIVLYKFQEQENTNLNQDIQLRAVRDEYRYYNTRAEKLSEDLYSLRLEVNTLKTKLDSEHSRMEREYRR